MRPHLYFWLIALLPLVPQASFAQGNAAQQETPSAQPRDLMVAPSAPRQTPEAIRSGNSPLQVTSTGVAANICEELVVYLEKEAAKAADAPPPAAAGTAQEKAAQPNTSTAGPGQTAPPMDRTQQTSGQSAPIPNNQSGAAANPIALHEARQLIEKDDRLACQKAAQQMRRAGIALPPGLLALAALREDLLLKSPSGSPSHPAIQE